MILGTVISGFLGSGKTTLINHVLGQAQALGKRIAVIVNEFGEIGIDGALVNRAAELAFVELDNGCLCCSLNQDLERTLEAIALRGNIDLVLVETTGIADPLTVFWTFTRPRLAAFYTSNLMLTTVDPLHVKAAVAQYPIALLQIEQAHVLVLTKVDRASAQEIAHARSYIAEHNPHAVIVSATDPGLAALVCDCFSVEHGWVPPRHEEHVSHSEFESISVPCPGRRLGRDEVEDRLEALPAQIVRSKGAVACAHGEGVWIFHKVADQIDISHSIEYVGPLAVVAIGTGFDRERLVAQLKKDWQ